MKITVGNKNYESSKITGRKYDKFCELMDKIEKQQEQKKAGYSREDMKEMRNLIVEVFDNQFTEEDLYDDYDVASLIFKFFEIQLDIEGRLNNKIEKVQKNYQGKKRK